MASNHQMIEPYEANQVKVVNGERIVSYGTSSYGYDVRCSNEFKVFTNLDYSEAELSEALGITL